MHKKTSPPRIGIDLMGSDTHPEAIYLAAIELAEKYGEQAQFTLFGTEEVFAISSHPLLLTRIASEIITMEDPPLQAVRSKKNSSMALGIQSLHDKELDAFISFGNTGALMALSTLILKTLPSIDRPALLALFPVKRGEVAVLDVGANTTFKAEHLVQFAKMGIAFKQSQGIAHPKIGLLNIGAEAMKGSPELRETYQQLKALTPHFQGNVEARDAMAADIDVLIADGVSGNVFLKTAEGIASFILSELTTPPFSRTSLPTTTQAALTTLKHHLDYSAYPGALLCGVQGVVFKCHGAFSTKALKHTVTAAIHLTTNRFLQSLAAQLS